MSTMQLGYVYGGATLHAYKFTGKERDNESGIDNFGARYYESYIGRFMTPDWSQDPDPIPYADYENPQTLNLYSYVQNNPLSQRDATGHVHCDSDTTTWGPGAVTVTAGACHPDWSDFPLLIGAFGHHYIPQAIWKNLDKASQSWEFLNKLTTRALKNPR